MDPHFPQNFDPVDDFEGLSPHQMEQLLYNVDYAAGSVILKNHESFREVPFLRQIEFLLSYYDVEKGLKLTPSGYLPLKLVKDLYAQGYLRDKDIDAGISELSSESKSLSIQLTHVICLVSKLIRYADNKEFLTPKYEKLKDSPSLLQHIFTRFVKDYNWGYFDGDDNDDIGRLGFNYTLYLLSKFGKEERPVNFYGEKYFRAFPMLCDVDFSNLCFILPGLLSGSFSILVWWISLISGDYGLKQ